jgi:hypothetical protein
MLICKVTAATALLPGECRDSYSCQGVRKMTEQTTEKFDAVQEIDATVTGQIIALKALVTHLLCLSTMNVALVKGDTNFARVAKDLEEGIREQIATVMTGQSSDSVSAAMRMQKEILETVMSQMKKETRLLRMAAKNIPVSE